jgi:ATP-dependent Lon protease, bacterial type
MAQEINPPGVVTGLAWTPVGGEILFIEATEMPGNDHIILTGQLGDVMKESARIALSLLKSRLPVNAIQFKEKTCMFMYRPERFPRMDRLRESPYLRHLLH